MKTLSQSAFATMIVLVSTAAAGPGTFAPVAPDAAGRLPGPMDISQNTAQPPEAFQALTEMRLAPGQNDAPSMLLTEDVPQDAAFLPIDLASPLMEAPVQPAGGQVFQLGWGGQTGVHPAAAYGYAAAGSAAPAWSGMQLAGSGGSRSGFSIAPGQAGAATGSQPDHARAEPGIVDATMPQLPAPELLPRPGDLDAIGKDENGQVGPGNAVPEPGSMLLIGAGLVGLAAARRKQLRRRIAG